MKEVDLNEVPIHHIALLCEHFEGEMFYVLAKEDTIKVGDIFISGICTVIETVCVGRSASSGGFTYYRAKPTKPSSDTEPSIKPSEQPEALWYVSKVESTCPHQCYPATTRSSARDLAESMAQSTGEVYNVMQVISQFERVPAEVKETVLEKTYTFSNKVVFAPPGVGSLYRDL